MQCFKQKMSHSQTQSCYTLFFNYLVASLGPWPVFSVSLRMDVASVPCVTVKMKFTLTRPHTGKVLKVISFQQLLQGSPDMAQNASRSQTGFVTWANFSECSFSLLEGTGRIILNCPSSAHILWGCDFTKETQIPRGAKAFTDFFCFFFPFKVFLKFFILFLIGR